MYLIRQQLKLCSGLKDTFIICSPPLMKYSTIISILETLYPQTWLSDTSAVLHSILKYRQCDVYKRSTFLSSKYRQKFLSQMRYETRTCRCLHCLTATWIKIVRLIKINIRQHFHNVTHFAIGSKESTGQEGASTSFKNVL